MCAYRIYIDEVGNSDLNHSADPNHRFLSLTGVIFHMRYVNDILFNSIETLKKTYFHSLVDDPVILHRKEIVNKKYPFNALRDPDMETEFNETILTLIKSMEYSVITVVIDKMEHNQRYQRWKYDPYHYCLAVMLERYAIWLDWFGGKGDAMAESRGGKEDLRLKRSFEGIYNHGTQFVPAQVLQRTLTSSKLKVKPKAASIAGLQFADLLAHPSHKATIERHYGRPLPDNFGGKISKILEESKYLRKRKGSASLKGILGYGRKVLP